jgi:hypothetical protein
MEILIYFAVGFSRVDFLSRKFQLKILPLHQACPKVALLGVFGAQI